MRKLWVILASIVVVLALGLGVWLARPAAPPPASSASARTGNGAGPAIPTVAPSRPPVAVTPPPPGVAPPCAGVFAPVASANLMAWNRLSAVAIVSPGDVWAVGAAGRTIGESMTLIEHWDGAGWRVVPSSNPGPEQNSLQAVAGTASTDVWAVGGYWEDLHTQRTLIEHWDGRQWSIVPSPDVRLDDGELLGVAVAARDNVWAVGAYWEDENTKGTLIEHWDGCAWTVVPSPSPGTWVNELSGIAAAAPGDIWAVGRRKDRDAGTEQTLIEHWDGSAWTVVPSPSPSTSENELIGIGVVTPGNIWAVGQRRDLVDAPTRTLIEHWDGGAWGVVPSLSPGAQSSSLNAVAGAAPGEVWAVGFYGTGEYGRDQTLIEHWDGTGWRPVSSPNPGPDNTLADVAVGGSGEVWAVGAFRGNPDALPDTLVALYTCAQVPAAVAVPTTATAPPP